MTNKIEETDNSYIRILDSLAISNLKPYIIRAFYTWMTANRLTPLLEIDTSITGPQIFPTCLLTESSTVLNISSEATRDLKWSDNGIEFLAAIAYEGEVFKNRIPMNAVISLLSLETSEGVYFGLSPTNPTLTQSTKHLTVIK